MRMWRAAVLWLVAVSSLGSVWAAPTRTQNVVLAAGWNAIWLEVDPAEDAVGSVFDPAKVDVVARYFTPATPVRFIEDPAETAWNTPIWGVWYAPSRAEAFLTSLHAIQGNSAYLVHALEDCTVSISGKVRFSPLRWNADSYNLTGLPVTGTAGPTFARFFSGAGGRVGAKVYRLVEGSWQKITDLATTPIRPGEAYWIYSDGKTNYQGPLELRFTGAEGVNFGSGANAAVIDLTNRAANAFSVKAAVESGGNLPLYRSVPDLANFTVKSVPLASETDLGTLAQGGVAQLRLEVRPSLLTESSGTALLRLSTSDGIVLRVPVRATLP